MKPTIAESKGPIAEAAVSSTPGDKVSALGVDRRPVCPSSRFFAAFIDPSRWVCLSSSVFARQPSRAKQQRPLSCRRVYRRLCRGHNRVPYDLRRRRGHDIGLVAHREAVVREDCAEVGLRRSALRNSMRLVARYLSSCISPRHNHRSEQQKKAAARGQVVRTVVINILWKRRKTQIDVAVSLLRRTNPLEEVGVEVDVDLFLFGDAAPCQTEDAPKNEEQRE